MEDISKTHSTLSSYLQASHHRSRFLLRAAYIQRLQSVLPAASRRYSTLPQGRARLAEALLDGEAELRPNVRTETPQSRAVTLITDYRSLKPDVFLSLMIPLNDTEAEQRRHENRHVFTLLDRTSSDDDSSVFVYNYGQFKNEICWFMKGKAANVFEAGIIVNAHGNPEGLAFPGEEVVSWTKVIEDLDAVSSQRSVEGHNIPESVLLILAPCNSRKATDVQTKQFVTVVPLSKNKENQTNSVVYFNKTNGKQIYDAHNLELENWLLGRKLKQRWRLESASNFRMNTEYIFAGPSEENDVDFKERISANIDMALQQYQPLNYTDTLQPTGSSSQSDLDYSSLRETIMAEIDRALPDTQPATFRNAEDETVRVLYPTTWYTYISDVVRGIVDGFRRRVSKLLGRLSATASVTKELPVPGNADDKIRIKLAYDNETRKIDVSVDVTYMPAKSRWWPKSKPHRPKPYHRK